jgi:ubiquinone/menaquinone biosynthesis C-methylase UbiE
MPSDQIRLFDATAPWYNAGVKYLTLGLYSRFLDQAIERINLQLGDKVLDVCTGTGINLDKVLTRVGESGEVVGVDLSRGMLKIAENKFGGRANVRLVYGDVTTMNTYQGYFDKAFMSFCIHEIEPHGREAALGRIQTMLKDGGELFIADYNNIPYEEHGLFGRLGLRILEREDGLSYLRTDLKQMLAQHGFSVQQQFPFFKHNLLITHARKTASLMID